MSCLDNLGRAFLAAASLAALSAWPATAQDLPKSTQKILEQLKLDRSILNGIDEELKVPDEWMAKAKAEGTLTYAANDTEAQFRAYAAPFVERYPFIKVEYEQGSYDDRVIKPLLAFKQGRYTIDVAIDITGSIHLFRDANALTDLSDIPNARLIRPEVKPKATDLLPLDIHYWCVAYNTTKIKKEDLPKTWEGFMDNKLTRGTIVGVNDRTMTWVPPLYRAWGAERTTKFLTDLMDKVQPQPRQEGINALTNLTSAGEVPISFPASDKQVYAMAQKGGKVAWHCPDPVPTAFSEIIVFRGSPHTYASKLFINWILSREGQIAQYSQIAYSPVHKDLPLDKFAVYPEELLGKQIAYIDPDHSDDDAVTVQKLWTPLWEKRIRDSKF